jgi:hypothetical protein
MSPRNGSRLGDWHLSSFEIMVCYLLEFKAMLSEITSPRHFIHESSEFGAGTLTSQMNRAAPQHCSNSCICPNSTAFHDVCQAGWPLKTSSVPGAGATSSIPRFLRSAAPLTISLVAKSAQVSRQSLQLVRLEALPAPGVPTYQPSSKTRGCQKMPSLSLLHRPT